MCGNSGSPSLRVLRVLAEEAGAGGLQLTLVGGSPGSPGLQHRRLVIKIVQRSALGELVEVAVVAEGALAVRLAAELLRERPRARAGPEHLLGVEAGLGEGRDERLLDKHDVGAVSGERAERAERAQLPRLLHRFLPAIVQPQPLHQVLEGVQVSLLLRVAVLLHDVGVHPEGDGVHGEGPDDGGAHTPHQTPGTFSAQTGLETVARPPVLLVLSEAVSLEAGLDDVLWVGQHPGQDPRHPPASQNHWSAVSELSDHQLVRAKVDPEGGDLPGEGYAQSPCETSKAGLVVDVSYSLRYSLLTTHLHLGLDQLHGGHDEALESEKVWLEFHQCSYNSQVLCCHQ